MNSYKKLNNKGVAHLGLILVILLVVGGIGFAAWRVLGTKNQDDKKSTNDGSSQRADTALKNTDSKVIWTWGGEKWMAQGGNAPECIGKPEFKMPVDINSVTSVLYPGQQRSTGHKTHGGFLAANADNNALDVTIPIDSHLIKASRYIEQGEVQYFLIFSVPCGYAYRFDHLRTLTPEVQKIIDTLPEPKIDDSRTTPIQPPVAFKQGTKVATAVGFKGSTGMDFGIYDVRQPNEASKRADYARRFANEKEFAFYGVCFLDGYMGDEVSAKLKSLPSADPTAGKTSDYCI